MREPTDDEFDRMSPAEKAAHARTRAGAKYGNPHLERTGDGSGRGGVVVWGVAIAAAVVLSAAAVYALQGQFGNLNEAHQPQYQQSPVGQTDLKAPTQYPSPVQRK
jgi:uncharacterized protein HemX